jgi:hypothetical protein
VPGQLTLKADQLTAVSAFELFCVSDSFHFFFALEIGAPDHIWVTVYNAG